MEYVFNRKRPDILVVDGFYKYPESIISSANKMQFRDNIQWYKGSRSDRHLLPYVKEEFERLLGVQITDWLDQPVNGCFQKTTANDPLVYHADSQDYAAAVYLTKDADDYGTSFWKDISYGYRVEPENIEHKNNILNPTTFTNGDNWKLVDKVGGVFNRLVLWNAKMIHSASMYGDRERLVQLFFFNVAK
jgi:hypothetical protein